MAYSELHGVALRGLSSVLPSQRVDNLDVPENMLKSRERLIRNIGIRYRHCCAGEQIFSDLALMAAKDVLRGVGWDSVDLLLVVTQSPEHPIPGLAVILQHRLGLPQGAMAFDINLGCSGYPYGINVAAAMLKANGLRRAVVVVGDQSADKAESGDQGRIVLFGDAATATALELDSNAPPMYFLAETDGGGYKAIYTPHGGRRRPPTAESFQAILCEDGIRRVPLDVWLDGPAIVNFSIARVPKQINEVLELSAKSMTDIDHFVFHQANKMINQTINQKLKLSFEISPMSLHDYGNTSSASIPLTVSGFLAERFRNDKITSVFSGFGIGLSWASLIVTTDKIYCPAPILQNADDAVVLNRA